jgi:hypothetical protein
MKRGIRRNAEKKDALKRSERFEMLENYFYL